MKKIYLMMLLNVSFMSVNAQNFAWAKKGGLWAYDYGYGIANDASGNVYVAGKYEKNANFSGVVLPCQGNHDIYVAQYSSSGNLNWIRTGGGPSGDYAHALAVEGSYVYIAGEIQGSNSKIIFPGSSITLTAVGDNDVFLAKYTLSGTLLWARSAGAGTSEKALGIAVDKSGNVFICGYYTGYTKFGSTPVYNSGGNDIFIAKYDANGNFQWVQKAGGVGRDEAKAIKCDASGNVYITGAYSDGCKFGSQTLTATKWEMFLAKYSTAGSLLWVKKGGGKYDDVGWSLAIDNYNNLYVGGEFNSSANFGGLAITTTGSSDIFVARYDLNGNINWIRKAGGTLPDRARGIACAGSNVYITGQYGKTAYFGPYTRVAADSSDIFIACLDNAGNYKWVSTGGGTADAYEDLGYESGNAICAETSGNVYATGAMLNGATFGSTTLSAYARTDMFLVKITSPATRDDDPVAENDPGDIGGQSVFTDNQGNLKPDIKDNITELNVYPNPANENFVMELNSKENVEYELTIFNSLGQIIDHRQITAPVVSKIDMADREKGIYIIEVKNAEEMYLKKVILR
jgi:hypothetical protein